MQPQPYVTAAADLAQKAPLTFVVVILAAILAGIIAGGLWLIWRGTPRLLEWLDKRAEADRLHQKEVLAEIRADASGDIRRSEEALQGAHKEIGQRVEAVHVDVKRLLVKIGASCLVFLLAGWLVLGIAHQVYLAASCNPPCNTGMHCCATPAEKNKCCKDTETAKSPRSETATASLMNYAKSTCDRLISTCSL